jgi:hypothetical protein
MERIIYIMVQKLVCALASAQPSFQSVLIRHLVRMGTAAEGLITKDIANPSSPRHASG